MKLLLLLILIIHPAYANDPVPVKSQKMNDSNMKTINFFDLKNTDHLNKDIAAFSAVVNISEIQSAASGGINLEFSLQYEGTNNISIHNPIYFIQYILKGTDKAQLFNGGKPPILLINRQGPIDETNDFNFDILRITKNRENLNIRDQVNMPIITFQKGDRQSYSLQISKYVNQQTRQPGDIPEGTYHLELLLSIVGSDAADGARSSRTLKAQDISFSYKKE
ncbi:MAG: hypothetical protein ACREUM_09620 [Nitrosospira sp.]